MTTQAGWAEYHRTQQETRAILQQMREQILELVEDYRATHHPEMTMDELLTKAREAPTDGE